MHIRIIADKVSIAELSQMAQAGFGDMVKAVVDLGKEIMAVGGGMHADAEEVLISDGSRQEDLWGINIFPKREGQQMIEFESLINIRPRDNNRTMEIQDEAIRNKIREIVNKLIEV